MRCSFRGTHLNGTSCSTCVAGCCQRVQTVAGTGQGKQQLKDARGMREGTMCFKHWDVLLNMSKSNPYSSEAGK